MACVGAVQGVDRGRAAVGAVRFEHARDASGCHQPAGGAGPQAAATAGKGDGHLPRARGALQPNVRRAHPPGALCARVSLRNVRVAAVRARGRTAVGCQGATVGASSLSEA
jgi:hypothetical protein